MDCYRVSIWVLAFLLPVQFGATWAAEPLRDTAAAIDDYVAEGMRANLGLAIQSLEITRSQAALEAARARFLPELALSSRYSRNDGGREINLQLDTLLNPVYRSLNELLLAQGRPTAFASLPSQSFAFQRPQEQDTRLTLRQPLYVPAIPAAVRAQSALLDVSNAAQTAFARRLKRDIAIAYLNWQRAGSATAIVESSRQLLAENLRVNDSLFRNGKVTQDRPLRAKAELLAVEQQWVEARNGVSQAQSYLNFLLNRSLDTPLEPSDPQSNVERTTRKLSALQDQALRLRPELRQAQGARLAAEARTAGARAARKPTLALGIDAGIQGERYEFGRGSDFNTISLVFSWALFDGGARRADVDAARVGQRQARLQEEQLAALIQLEVQQALDTLNTATESLVTAQARVEAARAVFRIAGRKRDEAVISQVEFIDARSALTSAELGLVTARSDVLSRQAELDYATAAGPNPEAKR